MIDLIINLLDLLKPYDEIAVIKFAKNSSTWANLFLFLEHQYIALLDTSLYNIADMTFLLFSK